MASYNDQEQILEADTYTYSDTEGYVSDSCGESTQSLTSSANEYIIENGRRYHAYYGQNKNPMPNDEVEKERLDLQHESFLILLDGDLYKAPIGKHPQNILDIGTGSGLWAIDVADKHPSASVLGLDLSPIQPNWVPPNCRFEMEDVTLEWTLEPDFYDMIHARNIGQAIVNWPKLLLEAFRCTKPGGYIEIAENGGEILCDDGTMKPNNKVKLFFERMIRAVERTGRPGQMVGSEIKQKLEKAGFVDVVVHKLKFPMAPWPKDRKMKQIGEMNLMGCETAFHAYGMALFTRVLGIENGEADRYCREAYEAVQDYKNTHLYVYHYIVHGRKPEAEEF